MSRVETQLLFIALDVSFVTGTVLMPIVVYVVFHTTSTGKYRWYVLNGIVWNYAVDVSLAFWRPVNLLPQLAAYSEGPVHMPLGAGYYHVIIGVMLLINVCLSACCCLFYRFAQNV
ncbi:hypothetical protein AAVH_14898 [Aphelenchoides avenae]|nr:hypothetical protein AAVH_14898 [Aphelenchus avenae]